MAYPTISVSTPANSDKKKNGAGQIRTTKQHIVDCMSIISGYPTVEAIKNATWTTSTRPTTGLVEGLTGYNSTTGLDEHWDATNSVWVVHDGKGKVIDVKALVDIVIPVGTIVMWSGAYSTIPSSGTIVWQICNGTNGTPNLLDKFVLSSGTTYALGATGGEATHTLTTDEIPSHAHGIPGDTPSATGTYNAIAANQGQSEQKTWTSGYTGGGTAHNNMPPYYALYYIMRIS